MGGLQVQQAGRSITRFRTYKTGVLLAYLAFYADKSHSREALTELLWPECDPDAGRNSLSKSLGSLRNQLEPPGVPAGAVIIADRATIRLNPLTCMTDIAAFTAAVQASRAPLLTPEGALDALTRAAELYAGELLPALYEDWNISERSRLTDLYLDTLLRLIALLERTGDLRRAREYVRRAIAVDPLREESHESFIALALAGGDPAAAVRQYHEWERLSKKELGSAVSAGLLTLVAPYLENLSLVSATQKETTFPAEKLPSALPAETMLRETVTLLVMTQDGQEAEAIVRRHGGVFWPQADCLTHVAVFSCASEAASCAVAMQFAAQGGLRLALQTGETDTVFGSGSLGVQGMHTLSVANPGQVLCSEATAVLLRRDSDPGIQVADLGLYCLPGGNGAERLFDLEFPNRAAGVPSRPNAEPASKTSLPLQLTRFFGRQNDLDRLLAHVVRARNGVGERLWTITGPGGMGKTRCSLEVARQSMAAFAGAVCFVSLAEIREPGLVINAIAEALHLHATPAIDPFSQVVLELSERPTLLVLDNFEQLVGPTLPDMEAIEIVGRLLGCVSDLTCLVTSRHRLGIVGEREFPLSPLPIPDGVKSPTTLADCESVRLFVDRAQAVRPDFQITSGNAAAVADLCERLEGLPLAIELAAARAQVLTPAQMLKQLERRFDFLVSRQRNFALRHRTIRAAIDWSYGLLTPDLRRFAKLLSVFRGGWNLAAAEAVSAEPLALDFLEQLGDCSLVLADTDGTSGEMRYRQLETLRQYAEEGLTVDQRDALKSRHITYFLALAEDAELNLQGPEQGAWLARLETDHDNLRAALQWCLELPGHAETGLRIARALWRFWHVRGYVTEGREQFARLLEAAGTNDVTETVLGQAQVAAGILARYQNDADVARALLAPGLDSARSRGDHRTVPLALYHLALVEVSQNNWAEARALLEESLGLCRTYKDRSGMASAMSSLAIVESEAGDFTLAQALFMEALALRRALCDGQGIATLLYNLGNVALLQTDYDRAQALFEESLALRRALGDKWGIASLLNSLGLILSNQKDYKAARVPLEESLVLFRALGDKSGTAVVLCNLGTVALMTQDPQARGFLAESLSLRWKIGDKLGVAFALEALAQLEVLHGDTTRAVTLWAVTQALRMAIGAPLPPANRATLEQAVTSAREAMDADVFTAAWVHGQGMELAQALTLVLNDSSGLKAEK